MKKTLALLLVGLFVISLSTTNLLAATRVCRLAEDQAKGYPTEMGDEKFAELVEAKTEGRIKIEVYFGGQLGPERQVLEQAKFGVIEFVRSSCSPMVSIYQPIGVFSMPYLFNSQNHMWKVLNGPVGEHFLKSIESAGLVGLTYFDGGARNFYTKKPVKNVADLKGLKIRVQENPIMVNMVQLLGAQATPIPYGEVYTALQTGVVDGAENNIPSWVSAGHYEVAKYLIKDGHTRIPEMVVASKKFWDTLSDSDKKAIREAAKEATEYQIKYWNEAEEKYLAQAKAKGCGITEVNVEEFQKAVAPIYEMPEYKDFKEWVAKIRATK